MNQTLEVVLLEDLFFVKDVAGCVGVRFGAGPLDGGRLFRGEDVVSDLTVCIALQSAGIIEGVMCVTG